MTGFNRIFLDTAPIIYFLEKSDLYYEKIKAILQKAIDEDVELCTSAITYEEYEVGPLKNNDRFLIEKFEKFIFDMEINVTDIDPLIASKAAGIRAEYQGYKGMDAVQIACAISQECDLFLTNDKQLRQTRQIACKTVDEVWDELFAEK